jgi:CheY-like chemotaxis protein
MMLLPFMNQKPTVIVVTQSGAVHNLIKRLLEIENYDVISPKLGLLAEAVHQAMSDNRNVVLAIVDCDMLEKDLPPNALVATLRTALQKPDLPYFLISNDPQPGLMLFKPFTSQEFLATVRLSIELAATKRVAQTT